MGKANISFPDGMLEAVDDRASAAGQTRSAFIREATAAYLAKLGHHDGRERRASRVEDAIRGMRGIGERLPPGPDSVTLLRRLRDSAPGSIPTAERASDGGPAACGFSEPDSA